MRTSLDISVKYVLNDEGGYAERENEPGGACNKGISFLLFCEILDKDEFFRKTFYPNLEGEPTFEDLKNLTDEAATYIYDKKVFSLVKFDDLPVGLDYVMGNTAVMQGPTGAIRLLQQVLEVPVTGKLDDETLSKIHPDNAEGIIILQMEAKMKDPRVGAWVDSNGEQQHGFGPGWANRLVRVWRRLLKMRYSINN